MPIPDSDDEAGVTAGAHYFSDDPATASRRGTVRLTLPDLTLELATDRGVFSAERVDPGTKLLLTELGDLGEPVAEGPVLDLGCGYGPIACTVALRRPGTPVWAVDVNRRARELCADNARRLGATVQVVAPDEVPGDLQFGAIVSNPPIRIGKAALHALLVRWLARLHPDGAAWLVVNRNLGADSLVAWLDGRGHRVQRLRSRQGYRILRVAPAAN